MNTIHDVYIAHTEIQYTTHTQYMYHTYHAIYHALEITVLCMYHTYPMYTCYIQGTYCTQAGYGHPYIGDI
jgi:hypothetical protein